MLFANLFLRSYAHVFSLVNVDNLHTFNVNFLYVYLYMSKADIYLHSLNITN